MRMEKAKKTAPAPKRTALRFLSIRDSFRGFDVAARDVSGTSTGEGLDGRSRILFSSDLGDSTACGVGSGFDVNSEVKRFLHNTQTC